MNVSSWEDSDKQGGRYRDYFPKARRYARTNHAGERGLQGAEGEIPLDLTAPLRDELRGQFDVVFNHTTLEHIYEVNVAFANLCALSRDAVIVVVPFSQLQHESSTYGDYWRFTPSCLRRMFKDNGFTVVYESESPHKDAAVYLLFVAARDPSKHAGRMPEHKHIKVAGRWIGASIVNYGIEVATYRARRLLQSRR